MLQAQDVHITFNPGTPIENRALRGLNLTIPTCDQELGAARHHRVAGDCQVRGQKRPARGTKGSACLMYLAKFFHRLPGNDDRELLHSGVEGRQS